MNARSYHECKQSEGKLVVIGLNELGQTSCDYCGKLVNYLQEKK